MDYLQYLDKKGLVENRISVLNLIINGLPSILLQKSFAVGSGEASVLNLIINGLPSIPKDRVCRKIGTSSVLNLIINGLPSIQEYYVR